MSLWIGRSGKILTRGGVLVNCNTCPCTGPSGECCDVAVLPDTATATVTIGGVTRVFSLTKGGGGGTPVYSAEEFCDCAPPQYADGSSCGWNDPTRVDAETGFPIPFFTYFKTNIFCNLDSVYFTGWTVFLAVIRAEPQYAPGYPSGPPPWPYVNGGVYDEQSYVRNFPLSSLPNAKFTINCRPFHLHFEATVGDGISYPGSQDDFTDTSGQPICNFPAGSTSVVMDVVTP